MAKRDVSPEGKFALRKLGEASDLLRDARVNGERRLRERLDAELSELRVRQSLALRDCLALDLSAADMKRALGTKDHRTFTQLRDALGEIPEYSPKVPWATVSVGDDTEGDVLAVTVSRWEDGGRFFDRPGVVLLRRNANYEPWMPKLDMFEWVDEVYSDEFYVALMGDGGGMAEEFANRVTDLVVEFLA